MTQTPPLPDSPYGMTLGVAHGANPPHLLPQTISDLNGLGTGLWLRYQLHWDQIEITQVTPPPTSYTSSAFDWSALDDAVSQCNAGGIHILHPIQSPPSWYMTVLAVDGTTQPYPGQVSTTLTAAITSGVATTTIQVSALPSGLANGTRITVDYGSSTLAENIKVSGTYGSGATALTVTTISGGTWTPAHSHSTSAPVATTGGDFAGASDWGRMAGIFASRYNGSVNSPTTGKPMKMDGFQIENENYDIKTPRDIQSQWLVPVVNAAVPAIKAAYPSVKCGVCAVRKTPTLGLQHVQNWVTNLFTYSGGCAANIDWLDFHYYRGTAPEDPTVGTTDIPSISQELAGIKSVCATYGYPNMPIWCNESGWDICDDGTGTVQYVTYAQQSQYLLAVMDAMRTGGGTKMMVYTMNPNITMNTSVTPNTSTETKSIEQKISGVETYLQAYTDWKNYITQYPTWVVTGGGGGGGGGTVTYGTGIKRQMVLVYNNAGQFLDVWRDAPLLAGFKESINAATSPIQVTLPRAFDSYDLAGTPGALGTIAQGNIVQYYLYGDALPTTGLLRYQGIIDAFQPQIADNGEESVVVTLVPQGSVIADHGLPTSQTFGTIGRPAQYVDPITMFNWFFTTVDPITGVPYMAPLTLDPTNPTTSGVQVAYTFVNEPISSIFTTILQMLPANWFYRINPNNSVTLNVPPTTAQHVFVVGQHLASPTYKQDWTGLKNVVYYTGYTPTGSTLPIAYTAVGSDVSVFGERLQLQNDSRVTDPYTLGILARGMLTALDQMLIRTTVRVVDYRGGDRSSVGYDIETLRVGDTCQIIDPFVQNASVGTAQWDVTTWDDGYWDFSPGQTLSQVVTIVGLTYNYDYVDLELANFQPNQDRALVAIQNAFQDFTLL